MAKVIEKNSIMIGSEPVVVLPLRKWERMRELLEDMEDAARFNIAFEESRGGKFISLEKIKRKYKF